MKSVSSALAAKQGSISGRLPYISLSGVGYTVGSGNPVTDRILMLEHHEEAYNDYALVVLEDHDRSIPNWVGTAVCISYGDHIAGGGTECSATPTLWVKHQQTLSQQGRFYTLLELEGVWKMLREKIMRTGTAPLYLTEYTEEYYSVYGLIDIILTECGITCSEPPDDGIITSYAPIFDINKSPFENAAGILYRLITMTKEYLRMKPSMAAEFVYPQAGDSAAVTYSTSALPFIYECTERRNLTIPNRIYAYGNDTGDDWADNYITNASPHGIDSDSIAAYMEVPYIEHAGSITSQAYINSRAAAILTRIKAEDISGIFITPHDCRIELYDKVAATDSRTGSPITYPTNNMARVSGITHKWNPGYYRNILNLGGVSTTESVTRLEREAEARAPIKTDKKYQEILDAMKVIMRASPETTQTDAWNVVNAMLGRNYNEGENLPGIQFNAGQYMSLQELTDLIPQMNPEAFRSPTYGAGLIGPSAPPAIPTAPSAIQRNIPQPGLGPMGATTPLPTILDLIKRWFRRK